MKWLAIGFVACQSLAIATGAFELSRTQPDTRPYVANWDSKYFHDADAHCVYFDQTKAAANGAAHFTGYAKADIFGEPCEHCLSAQAKSAARTAARPRP